LQKQFCCLLKPDGTPFAEGIIKFILREGEFNVVEARWIKITPETASLIIPSDLLWFETVGGKVRDNCLRGGIDIRSHFSCDIDLIAMGKEVKKWNTDYLSEKESCFIIMNGDELEAKKFKDFAGRTDETDPATIRGAFRNINSKSIIECTLERVSYRNIVHVADPDRMALELGILSTIEYLSIWKEEKIASLSFAWTP